MRLIAENGFGDSRNVYAWSMARFRGRIYVGTGRLVACVENQTIDFFLRVSERYVTNPLPGATCPPDPYDMDLRAEIWEYTPRTGKWRRVYRSRADVPNPRAPGKFVARDIAFRGMTVFRDARGRKRLYVGGVTADEYLPELKRKYPPRILSTGDGRHWRATPARDVVVRVPYGVFRPMGFRSLRVWRGRMYVTATPGLTGDGAIFEVKRPWSPRRARFRQITPSSMAVFEIDNFNGALYAGTGDRERGYGVYRITRKRSRYRFEPIVTDGAGRGRTVTSVVSMHAFKGRLYVGSSGWYNEEGTPVSEIIRIDRAGGWQVVTGPARTVRGQLVGPISGLSDGFNNVFTAHFWRMATYRGELVVGTNDWAYLIGARLPGLEPMGGRPGRVRAQGRDGLRPLGQLRRRQLARHHARRLRRQPLRLRRAQPRPGGRSAVRRQREPRPGHEGVELPLERLPVARPRPPPRRSGRARPSPRR